MHLGPSVSMLVKQLQGLVAFDVELEQYVTHMQKWIRIEKDKISSYKQKNWVPLQSNMLQVCR